MTTGSDTFANAPDLPYGSLSAGTPSAGLTTEPGEPDLTRDGTNQAYDRSAWWKFTAPATETVGVDTLMSVIDTDPANIFNYDTVLHVYTGTSLDALTLVAENDDNSRFYDEADNSRYGYLSELDFDAVAGTTYYLRVVSWVNTLDMVYVLRLGKRVIVIGDWIQRPDMTIPVDMADTGKWDWEYQGGWVSAPPDQGIYVGGPFPGFKISEGSFITPSPGFPPPEPPRGQVKALLDSMVVNSAATTSVDNVDPNGDPYPDQTMTVSISFTGVNHHSLPYFPYGVSDTRTDVSVHARAFAFIPKDYVMPQPALYVPTNDPGAWDYEEGPRRDYGLPEYQQVTIGSDFALDRWQAAWQVSVQLPAGGNWNSTHPDVPGTMIFQVLTGPFVVNDYRTWDLSKAVTFAQVNFTHGLETVTVDVPAIPNAIQPDGSFVLFWKVTSLGDLSARWAGDTFDIDQGYRFVEAGPPWYFYVEESYLTEPKVSMSVQYQISDIPPYRLIYPTIELTSTQIFYAKDLKWQPITPELAGSTAWSNTAPPIPLRGSARLAVEQVAIPVTEETRARRARPRGREHAR